MFVIANAIFLEDDYIMNRKPKGMIVLEEVMGEPSNSPVVNRNTEQENVMTLPNSTPIPRRSGRIIREPNRFMFLGEPFEAVSENLESNHNRYKEAMANSDSSHWVKAMKTEMESIDSNKVWDFVEPPANIKQIGRASCRERVFRAV